jgi:predicted HicB family RNase H-like nuclease
VESVKTTDKKPKEKEVVKTLNIDASLHQRIRIAAAQEGVLIKQWIKFALEAMLP